MNRVFDLVRQSSATFWKMQCRCKHCGGTGKGYFCEECLLDHRAFTDWITELLNLIEPDVNRRLLLCIYAAGPEGDQSLPPQVLDYL